MNDPEKVQEFNARHRQIILDFFHSIGQKFPQLKEAGIELKPRFAGDHFLLRIFILQADSTAPQLEIEGRVVAPANGEPRLVLKARGGESGFQCSFEFAIGGNSLAATSSFQSKFTGKISALKFQCRLGIPAGDIEPEFSGRLEYPGEKFEFEAKVDRQRRENYWQNLSVGILSWLAVRDDAGLLNTVLRPVLLRQPADTGNQPWQRYRDSSLGVLISRRLAGQFEGTENF